MDIAKITSANHAIDPNKIVKAPVVIPNARPEKKANAFSVSGSRFPPFPLPSIRYAPAPVSGVHGDYLAQNVNVTDLLSRLSLLIDDVRFLLKSINKPISNNIKIIIVRIAFEVLIKYMSTKATKATPITRQTEVNNKFLCKFNVKNNIHTA